HLQGSAPCIVQAFSNRFDFLKRSLETWDICAAGGPMNAEPAGCKAESTCFDRLSRKIAHAREIFGSRRIAGGATRTHCVNPERAVRQIASNVDVAFAVFESVEILGKCLPVPRQAFSHYDARNILNTLHHFDKQALVLLSTGREADTAIASDYRG